MRRPDIEVIEYVPAIEADEREHAASAEGYERGVRSGVLTGMLLTTLSLACWWGLTAVVRSFAGLF
jgi:hypothetical protein